MTQINVYIINPVVMGFQTQICPILRVFWSILVKCCVHLPKSSSKTRMLPLEKTILHKYWLFCLEILRVYIWPLWPFVFCLSFVNNSWNNVTTPSTNQRFWPDSGQILRHQYGNSVAESQTFLLAKRPQGRRARRNGCFRRLGFFDFVKFTENIRLLAI